MIYHSKIYIETSHREVRWIVEYSTEADIQANAETFIRFWWKRKIVNPEIDYGRSSEKYANSNNRQQCYSRFSRQTIDSYRLEMGTFCLFTHYTNSY
jgi:hypothetical protein